MRPLQQELSVSHIFTRKGVYYFRSDIPSDLSHHFPIVELKKSLKTRDLRTAKVAARELSSKLHRICLLLRVGLPEDISSHLVATLVPVKKKQVRKANKMLSDVIKTYTAEKSSGWTDKTALEVKGIFRLMVDILGDKDVKTIDRPMLVELRNDLLKVPPHFYKRNPGKSVREGIKASKQGVSCTTVNKQMSIIGSLLKYCQELGYLPTNPASGLQIADKQRADEQRKVYSRDDLKAITSRLPSDKTLPERYWIPLIAMYSGMRLQEISQLYRDDLRLEDGVWVFDINDRTPDKQIKTTSSRRLVPVHPELILLGLLDYHSSLTTSERLWPNLSYLGLHGLHGCLL